jgi:hypothetical protein
MSKEPMKPMNFNQFKRLVPKQASIKLEPYIAFVQEEYKKYCSNTETWMADWEAKRAASSKGPAKPGYSGDAVVSPSNSMPSPDSAQSQGVSPIDSSGHVSSAASPLLSALSTAATPEKRPQAALASALSPAAEQATLKPSELPVASSEDAASLKTSIKPSPTPIQSNASSTPSVVQSAASTPLEGSESGASDMSAVSSMGRSVSDSDWESADDLPQEMMEQKKAFQAIAFIDQNLVALSELMKKTPKPTLLSQQNLASKQNIESMREPMLNVLSGIDKAIKCYSLRDTQDKQDKQEFVDHMTQAALVVEQACTSYKIQGITPLKTKDVKVKYEARVAAGRVNAFMSGSAHASPAATPQKPRYSSPSQVPKSGEGRGADGRI